MKNEGRSFTGILYAGLMLTAEGPKVIEYNARFGDPETQVVLPRLESDLVDVLVSLLQNESVEMKWSDEAVIGVVLAATGYPNEYQKGAVITGFDQLAESTMVFHAGTDFKNGEFVTNGGRVLAVVAKGTDLIEAQKEVYKEIVHVQCSSLFYRKDIGNKAISHVSS